MNSYIKSIIVNTFPTWEESIWNALQKKDWQKFEIEFDDFLSRLEEEEIKNLPWADLIKGQALLHGDNVSLEEWQKYIQPIIAIAIVNSLDGFELAQIYSELDLSELFSFHKNLIKIIPAETESLKLEWLKENKPTFYIFLVASPINALINISEKDELLYNNLQNHYENFPLLLKLTITDYHLAEIIFDLGNKIHLSNEKIKKLAEICGQALIGFIKQEEIFNEIKNKLTLDENTAKELDQKIKEIIKPLEEEINNLQISIADIISLAKKQTEKIKEEKIIPLEKFEPTETTTKKIEVKIERKTPINKTEAGDIVQNKPFILHEEKSLNTEQEKPKITSKTFTFPFKIFATKPKLESTQPVKAEIKIEDPDKQTSPEKKKITIFKKESPQKIVHYSEMRTPLESPLVEVELPKTEMITPKEKEIKPSEEIINLEILQPQTKPFIINETKETEKLVPEKIEPNTSKSIPNEKNRLNNKIDNQPKLEGNTINLKNLKDDSR